MSNPGYPGPLPNRQKFGYCAQPSPHTCELAQKVGLATEYFNGSNRKKAKKAEVLQGFSLDHTKAITF
ncbi:hypothetical protein R50076_22440 [Gilvimarinus japonicus]|jgi:hypothetical protein